VWGAGTKGKRKVLSKTHPGRITGRSFRVNENETGACSHDLINEEEVAKDVSAKLNQAGQKGGGGGHLCVRDSYFI